MGSRHRRATSGQRDLRQLKSPRAASHHPPSEYRPAAPAEENSSLTTAGSRACRGCPKGWPRTLSVYSSRSLVGLHTLEGFPDFPFGDVERLYLAHGLLPLPVGLWPRLNNASPFAPAPLQDPHHYYGLLRPCAPHRYSRPRGRIRLWLVASRHRRDGAQVLTFHTKAWSSFAPPTCRMPLGPYQASPELIPEEGSPPGSDIA